MLAGGDEPAAEKTEAKPEAKPRPALALCGHARPFVFNVAGGQQDRLVQIKIQLMVRGTAETPGQTEYSPDRRHPAAGLQLGDR